MAEIKLGADIDCVCPRCKKDDKGDVDRSHAITAIVEGQVKKVRCNTCGYEHSFSTAKKAAAGTAKKRTTKEKDPALTEAATSAPVTTAQYERLIGNRDITDAKPYSFSLRYNEGDLIKHATFGVGLVTCVKCDNKIAVMFPERLRLLVHNRQSI